MSLTMAIKAFFRKYKKETNNCLCYLLIYKVLSQCEAWLKSAGFRKLNDWIALNDQAFVICVMAPQVDEAIAVLRKKRPLKPVDGVLVVRDAVIPATEPGSSHVASAWIPDQVRDDGGVRWDDGGSHSPSHLSSSGSRSESWGSPQVPHFYLQNTLQDLTGCTETFSLIDNLRLSKLWQIRDAKSWQYCQQFHQTEALRLLNESGSAKQAHRLYAFASALKHLKPAINDNTETLLDCDLGDGPVLAPLHWQHIQQQSQNTPIDQKALRKIRFKRCLYALTLVILSICLSAFWVSHLLTARDDLNSLKNDLPISAYQTTTEVGVVLPSLSHWQWLSQFERQHFSSGSLGGLIIGTSLQSSIARTYRQLLRKQFFAYLLLQTHENLQLSVKQNWAEMSPAQRAIQSEQLLQALQAYLSLGDQKHRQAKAFLSLFSHRYWQHSWRGFESWSAFSGNVKQLFKLSLSKPKLDQTLIQQSREILWQSPVAQQLYWMAQMQAVSWGDWSLIDHVDVGVQAMFSFKQKTIPLYLTAKKSKRFARLLSDGLSQNLNQMQWLLKPQSPLSLDNASLHIVQQQIQNIGHDHALRIWEKILAGIHLQAFSSTQQAIAVLDHLAAKPSAFNRLSEVLIEQLPALLKPDYVNWSSQLNNPAVTKAIQGLALSLNQIAESGNVAADSMALTIKILNGQDDNLIRLYQLARSMPQPIRSWLQSVAVQYQKWVFHLSMQELQQQWQMKVWSLYQHNIANQFPFDRSAERSVDLKVFKQFFAQSGPFVQFEIHMLKPLIQGKKWKSWQGVSLMGNAKLLNQIERLTVIKKQFFDSSGKLHSVIELTPVSMSAHLASFSIQSGRQKIIYQHGPLSAQSMMWPTGNVIVRAVSMHGKVWQQRFVGDWGLFRVLDSAEKKAGGLLVFKSPYGVSSMKVG